MEAVSYTHLDVYKRQVYCGGNPILFMDRNGLDPIISGGATYTINDVNYHLPEGRGVDLDDIPDEYWEENSRKMSGSSEMGLLLDFPFVSQGRYDLCWAASSVSNINWFTGATVSFVTLAQKFYDSETENKYNRGVGWGSIVDAINGINIHGNEFSDNGSYLNNSGYKVREVMLDNIKAMGYDLSLIHI